MFSWHIRHSALLPVLATETFLLSDLECGTICHRNCNTRISALDNSETRRNRISLGFSQPRRIVTFWLWCLRSSLTYLLTYFQYKILAHPLSAKHTAFIFNFHYFFNYLYQYCFSGVRFFWTTPYITETPSVTIAYFGLQCNQMATKSH